MENEEASIFNADSDCRSKCSHKLCFTSNVNVIWCDMWSVDGKGNGTPLRYSCLENPMDGGAW